MTRRAARVVLAYDAGCGPCTKFKAIVSFIDARRRMEFLSLEAAEALGLLECVPPSTRFASFHLVRTSNEGKVEAVSGSDAVGQLVSLVSPMGFDGSLVGRVPILGRTLAWGYSGLSRLHRGCPVSTGRGQGPGG